MDNLSTFNIPVKTIHEPNIETSNNIYEAPNVDLNKMVNQNPVEKGHKRQSVKETILHSKNPEVQKTIEFFRKKKRKKQQQKKRGQVAIS